MRSIAVDTGGTFTDTAVVDGDGRVSVYKAPSTPQDPLVGILASLRVAARAHGLDLDELLAATERFVYGTTIVTNTIVQRTREGRTGLLTTRGFRDTLAIRRGIRKRIFDMQEPYPVPLIARRSIREVTERLDASGDVRISIDLDQAIVAARDLIEGGCQALAICFLHSYLNPEHEKALKARLLDAWPELHVSASYEVSPEMREFERTSTTVMNAYVGPAVSRHLEQLEMRLKDHGLRSVPLVMQSNGGIMGTQEAARKPVALSFSGPAGGMTAALHLGELGGESNIITVDMGGTSFDVGLVIEGKVSTVTHGEVESYPLLGKRVDIHSIGAGGGSIASVDVNGLIKVGPASAGSDPGPACYGRGGKLPTVTDADLLLGFIDPDHFAAGTLQLDYGSAKDAIESHICRPTGMDPVEAAAAIYRIINARMVDAMRLVTVQRGHDPREFAVMAFGGAGPVHAAAIAGELGSRSLVVPALATGLSAVGLALSDIRHSFVRSMRMGFEDFDFDAANRSLGEMEEQCRKAHADEGVDLDSIVIEISMDMCYKGQLHELEIPISHRRLDPTTLRDVKEDFERQYKKYYGFVEESAHIQAVAVRVDSVGVIDRPEIERHPGRGKAEATLKGVRQVFSPFEETHVDTPIYDGGLVLPDMEFEGPALIEYPGTNVVIPAGYKAVCDSWLNLVMEG